MASDSSKVALGQLCHLNHDGLNPLWKNRFVYDSINDKLVLAYLHTKDSHRHQLPSKLFSDEESVASLVSR